MVVDQRKRAALFARSSALATALTSTATVLLLVTPWRTELIAIGLGATLLLGLATAVASRIAWGREMRIGPIGIVALLLFAGAVIGLIWFAEAWSHWTF